MHLVMKYIYTFHLTETDRDRQRQTDAVAAAALRSSFPRTNLSFNLFVSAYMATTQYMWLIEMDGHYWKEMDAWNRKF